MRAHRLSPRRFFRNLSLVPFNSIAMHDVLGRSPILGRLLHKHKVQYVLSITFSAFDCYAAVLSPIYFTLSGITNV